jgi:Rrf2 family transcriptional regulator, cysteine metabolism repressor
LRVNLSVKSDYAARAILSLARRYPADTVLRIEDVAREQGVPPPYLSVILAELKGKGIVRSVRGKDGGYLLARPPAEITLGDVLRAVHGPVFDTPALRGNRCPPELRRAWQRMQQALDTAADAITFQQLIEEAAAKEKMYYI